MFNKMKDKLQQAKVAAGILHRNVYTGPWNVQIDLTNQCNNDCLACWCNSPLLRDKAMEPAIKNKTLSYKTVIKLIDDLDELGARQIYFTGGGEPFMHPRILDIMRYVKRKGLHLDMSTNFTLVNEKIAEQLVETGVDHMTLSLWSGTPQTYAKLHPNKNENTFLKMSDIIDYIANIKAAKGTKRPALGMYNVINIYNFHEVNKMLEFAFKHKMDDIAFTPIDTVPNRTDHLKLDRQQRKILAEEMKVIPEKIVRLEDRFRHHLQLRDYQSFLKRLEDEGAEDANYDSVTLNSLSACYAGWSFARILANGDVNSCLKSFKIPIGNIYKNSFGEIWFGVKQQEFRKHTINYNMHDPYFNNMGNDRATKDQGCSKCCDNLGINMTIHRHISELRSSTRVMLKIASIFWR